MEQLLIHRDFLIHRNLDRSTPLFIVFLNTVWSSSLLAMDIGIYLYRDRGKTYKADINKQSHHQSSALLSVPLSFFACQSLVKLIDYRINVFSSFFWKVEFANRWLHPFFAARTAILLAHGRPIAYHLNQIQLRHLVRVFVRLRMMSICC
jgi:hypothetical protein